MATILATRMERRMSLASVDVAQTTSKLSMRLYLSLLIGSNCVRIAQRVVDFDYANISL